MSAVFLGFPSSSFLGFPSSSFLLGSPYISFLSHLSFCHAISFYTASFSIGFHLRSFSAPAFSRYCLLSSHALPFLSLGVLVLSASLAFPHFSYTVHVSPSSFFPSCSSLPFRSLGALLTRSNLRFPPRRGPPFGPGRFPIRFFALLYGWLFFAVPWASVHLSPSAPLLLLVPFWSFFVWVSSSSFTCFSSSVVCLSGIGCLCLPFFLLSSLAGCRISPSSALLGLRFLTALPR